MVIKRNSQKLPGVALKKIALDLQTGTLVLDLAREGNLTLASQCNLYVALPVNFAAGEVSKTLSVASAGDAAFSAQEAFGIYLADAENAAFNYTATESIVAIPTVITVASVSGATVIEGGEAVHTVTLSGTTTLPTILAFSIVPITASAIDYSVPPTFTNGVLYNAEAGIINVPVGISAFAVHLPTVDDSEDEINETYTIAVGGVGALGTITDNDTAPPVGELIELARVAVYEAPYQALSPAQKTAVAGNGGYAAFAVSRDNDLAASFNLYRSNAPDGTFAPVLNAQTFMPSANLTGAIDHVSSVIAYNNEIDMPASITADSNGLLVDTAGNIEMCLIGALTTNTVFGVTAKNMSNIKRAAYHYLPVHVDSAESARMFILPAAQIIDPTLHAQGTTVYYKAVPVNAQGVELALSSVTPIAFTATGVANKPYPPKFVGWNNTGTAIGDLIIDDFELYPTYETFWLNPKIYVGNSDRTESTPSSLMNPATTMEAGTSLVVEELNRDDDIRNSYTVTDNKATINNLWSNPTQKYRVYAVRGGVRSQEVIYILNSAIRDIGGVASVSGAIVGANAEVTITLTAQSQTVTAPWALGYTLTGSVMTDNAHGTITLTNGATFEDNGFIQVPPALSSFKVIVPLVDAASKTLTFTLGWFQYNDTISTSINVPAGVAYADLVGIVNGYPSVTPTDTLGDPYQLQMSYPSNNWYGAFNLTSPQPNIAGTPRLLTNLAIDEEFDIEYEFKTSIASVGAGSYSTRLDINFVTLTPISHTTVIGQNGNYAGVSTARFKNTSGAAVVAGSPGAQFWLTNPGADTNLAHTVTIRNLRIL